MPIIRYVKLIYLYIILFLFLLPSAAEVRLIQIPRESSESSREITHHVLIVLTLPAHHQLYNRHAVDRLIDLLAGVPLRVNLLL